MKRVYEYQLKYTLLMCLGFLYCVPLEAATLLVGSSREIQTPAEAATRVQDGDTVIFDPEVYTAGAVWTKNNLTLRGTQAVATMQGGSVLGKGIWVIQGKNTTVEYLTFIGATVPDGNGAGIRQEGDTLTVRHSKFFRNENAILTGNQGRNRTSDIIIEHSEFAQNGAGDGLTHNLYIGEVRSLTFYANWSRDSIGGQLLKSRAATNHIFCNRLVDSPGGRSNYELDLSNGGVAYVIGNVLRQDPSTNNSVMFTFGPEGAGTNPPHKLYVINNTFIQDRFSGIAIQVRGTIIEQIIQNNLFVGAGSALWMNGVTTLPEHNIATQSPAFVDQANQNYRPTAATPGVDQGVSVGRGGDVDLMPQCEHLIPMSKQVRAMYGSAIDMGAYELGTPIPKTPLTASVISGGVASSTSLSLQWTPSLSEEQKITGYILTRNDIPLLTTPSLTYVDTAVPPHTPMHYSVQAIGEDGQLAPLSNMLTLILSPPRVVTGPPIPPEPGWYELANTTLSAVCYDKPPSFRLGGCRAVIDVWNSGAFDTKRHRLILWGGGHNAYYGNELYALNLDAFTVPGSRTPPVERLNDPALPPAPGNCLGSGDVDCIACSATQGCMLSVANHTQANARHTYDSLAYIPQLSATADDDGMYTFGGSLACVDGCGWRDTWVFHFTTMTWERRHATGDLPKNPIVATAYDPNTGKLLIHDRTCLRTYDPLTNVYSLLPGGTPCVIGVQVDYHPTGVLNPVTKRFFMFQADPTANAYRCIADPAASNYGACSRYPTTGWPIGAYPGLAYDPVGQRIVGWNGGDTAYWLHEQTAVWMPMTFPGGPGKVSYDGSNYTGTFKRWSYSPQLDAFVVVNDIERNAFVFRAPREGVTPPPPCDDTCTTCGTTNACGRVCPACPPPPVPAPSDGPGSFVQRLYSDKTWLKCIASGPGAKKALTWVLAQPPPLGLTVVNTGVPSSARKLMEGHTLTQPWDAQTTLACHATGQSARRVLALPAALRGATE